MNEYETILVTGASGLIGRPLCGALSARGHSVRTVSRGGQGDFQWDPSRGQMDPAAMHGVSVIIHLAGESVAQRWTLAAKERILRSRTESTKLLVEAALKERSPPVYIAASGISYYGIDREIPVDESSESGQGFLAEVTRQWERAAKPFSEVGARCAFLRTGIVLSAQGGALAKMLTPFKMGLGGRMGDGAQMMSWISLEDLVRAYVYTVENGAVSGPVNAVAPHPVSNGVFTKMLGKVLSRPTIIPMPESVVATLFGEMGRETILSNLQVMPKELESLGFKWNQPFLEEGLRYAVD